MSPLRRRALISLAVAIVAAGAAAIPLRPIARLANYKPDGPGPIYDKSGVDDAALRRAGTLLPNSARTYFVSVPAGMQRDVAAGAFLYLIPSLPVTDPRKASWVLSYRAGRPLPTGLHVERVYRVGDQIFLVKVAKHG